MGWSLLPAGTLRKGGMYSGDVDIHHITAKASTLCTMI